VRLPFGELPLGALQRDALANGDGGASAGRRVVVGIRPEAFEDAALVGDRPGGVVEADIELVESVGSDVYAHLAGEPEVVARLSPECGVRAGTRARLWVDTAKLHLFDADSGASLTSSRLPQPAASA
jgi:multiple sugar transport system ATP-binding protein